MTLAEQLSFEAILRQEKFQNMQNAARQAIAVVDDARQGRRVFFPTKWPRLNRQLLGGLIPGKLYIIAGRPGVGKSAFSNQMVFDMLDHVKALGKDVVVLYWSFEMPGYEQILRDAAKDTRLDTMSLYSVDKALDAKQFEAFKKSVATKFGYPVYFMNRTKEASEIERICTDLTAASPKTVIINLFDHSRLIPQKAEKSEMERLNTLSKTCMRMQSNLGTLNILLSQLNREIEKEHRAKNQYQPMLTDLFGGDSVGQDAHVVMMLQRPGDLYNITDKYCGQEPKGLLACHIEKNRQGGLGMVPFEFDGSTFTIKERK